MKLHEAATEVRLHPITLLLRCALDQIEAPAVSIYATENTVVCIGTIFFWMQSGIVACEYIVCSLASSQSHVMLCNVHATLIIVLQGL